ncbi:MAG: Radical SAM superfamily enzyme [Candidatus Woesebacteria bacterium GW2011_GWB1_39_12]|uniref:Radical SAM superfamily enzyme n=1 Tax=Candidatus Woesebacteria bacterium GW2011_GWB1_39_12 TaxID=1618574 RepID=A0A0G0PU14_9BACT|nr:MAG: Radical SAM superfamily enzyme [Candidatus Woesebacteria bacterium GW2011_GWB1_39_12]
MTENISVYQSCLRPQHRILRYAKRKLGFNQAQSRIIKMSREQAKRVLYHRDFPLSVNILLGNFCNLSCPACPYHGSYAPSYFRQFDKMSDEVIDRLVDELPHYQTNAKFGGFEEPLAFKAGFKRITTALRDKGLGVHVTTNGTLITDDLLHTLQNLSTMYVSLDAHSIATYKTVRGADFNKVVANIEKVRQGFKGVKFGVSFIRQPKNEHEMQVFKDHWITKADMVIIYALLEFNKHDYKIDRPFLASPKERIVCSSPFLETYVLPNGDVSLCCETLLLTDRDSVPIMGNIKERSLHEIWNGEQYRAYRDALVDENWKIAAICQQCPLWAASYYETHNENGVKVTHNPTTEVLERIAN